MKKLLIIVQILLFVSCNDKDDEVSMTPNPVTNPPTEAITIKGLKYGIEARQFLDLYKPASSCPTPIYFDAHPNGGNTNLPTAMVDDLNALGITVIAWESLTTVSTTEQVDSGWNDAALMFDWVFDNANRYNLDTNQIIVGGSSRGSILSWKYGHNGSTNIKGLYMYNALPSNVWNFPNWWYPPNDVTTASPPIFFVYRREPGSSRNATNPDIHDPNNGFTIMSKYDSLGIGKRDSLIHSIGDSTNKDRYQYLKDFAASVLATCP